MSEENEIIEEEEINSSTNYLEMTDEEISNMALIPDEENVAIEEEESTNEETIEVSPEETNEIETPDEEETVGTSNTEKQDVFKEDSNLEEIIPDEANKKEDTETKEPETSINYEAEYKKILSPFRANNKDIQVASVDDAITLMKMGANYNKKMAGLKPNLKLLKMLENNDLLNEEKLSYLIDLDKKNPEAVSKLLKDSGVDPLEVDVDKETNYKPNTYTVDDKEVELDGILDEIRDTASFKDTIDIVGNKWDENSRQVLVDNPEVIKVINDHVSTGIYEQISSVVESERMVGRLTNMTDLEAYKHVGDVLNKQGYFNQPQQTSSTNTAKNEAEVQPINKPVSQKEAQIKNRKKAASSTKGNPNKVANSDFNPLALSDEEFDKLVMNF